MQRLFLAFFISFIFCGNAAWAQEVDSFNNDFVSFVTSFPSAFDVVKGAVIKDSSGDEKYVSNQQMHAAKSTAIVADRHWGGINRIVADLGTTTSQIAADTLFDVWTARIRTYHFLENKVVETDFKKTPQQLIRHGRYMIAPGKTLSAIFNKFTVQLEMWKDKAGNYSLMLKMGLPEDY